MPSDILSASEIEEIINLTNEILNPEGSVLSIQTLPRSVTIGNSERVEYVQYAYSALVKDYNKEESIHGSFRVGNFKEESRSKDIALFIAREVGEKAKRKQDKNEVALEASRGNFKKPLN